MPSAALSTASSPRYTDPAWKDSGLTLITPMTATGDASPSMTPASSARDRREKSHDTIPPAPPAASAGRPAQILAPATTATLPGVRAGAPPLPRPPEDNAQERKNGRDN